MIKKTKVFPSSWPETAQGEDPQWGFQARELGPGPSTRCLSTAPSPPSNRHHPQAWGAAHRESPSPTASTATTATAHSRPIPAPPYLPPLLLLPLTKLLQAPQLLTQGQGQLDVGAAHVLHFWGWSKDSGPRCQTWWAPATHIFAPAWASPPQPHSSSLSPQVLHQPRLPASIHLSPTVGDLVFPEGPVTLQPGVGSRRDLRCFRESKEALRELQNRKTRVSRRTVQGNLKSWLGPGTFILVGGPWLTHTH